MYRSRESAERAYRGYLGSRYAENSTAKVMPNAVQEGIILAERGHTTETKQNKNF